MPTEKVEVERPPLDAGVNDRKSREAAIEASEQLERCYSRVFNSDDGKAVLEDLRKACFIDQSTFVPGCADSTYINEGCRRVFLRIVQKTRMDLTESYLRQQKER